MDAAIFDLDGTLVDSLEDLADSMNQALEEFGFPTHPVHAYRSFVGDGIAALVSRALPPDVRGEESVARSTSRMRQIYAFRWNLKTRPYAGITEMLAELARRKVPIAVLSNKPHAMTEKVVRELLPASRFQTVLGAEAGFARKPDPAGALESARRLASTPERTVYIGDSDTDMETATAAGMVPIGVLWGFRKAGELRAAGAVSLVEHPREILRLFGNVPAC